MDGGFGRMSIDDGGFVVDRLVVGSVDRLLYFSVDRCASICSIYSTEASSFPTGFCKKWICLYLCLNLWFERAEFVDENSFPHVFFIKQIIVDLRRCIVDSHDGIVIVILPIFWTTVDRFFFENVDGFLVSTVDRCRSVSFDRCQILCLILCSKVAYCNEY